MSTTPSPSCSGSLFACSGWSWFISAAMHRSQSASVYSRPSRIPKASRAPHTLLALNRSWAFSICICASLGAASQYALRSSGRDFRATGSPQLHPSNPGISVRFGASTHLNFSVNGVFLMANRLSTPWHWAHSGGQSAAGSAKSTLGGASAISWAIMKPSRARSLPQRFMRAIAASTRARLSGFGICSAASLKLSTIPRALAAVSESLAQIPLHRLWSADSRMVESLRA
mmetsp:Transcript_41878/g.100628  ORF Transcript_41878/g.100628 Transcript_41878/m.100628 type:complete len:229 (-) Transcript_41878:367-1053(-)